MACDVGLRNLSLNVNKTQAFGSISESKRCKSRDGFGCKAVTRKLVSDPPASVGTWSQAQLHSHQVNHAHDGTVVKCANTANAKPRGFTRAGAVEETFEAGEVGLGGFVDVETLGEVRAI